MIESCYNCAKYILAKKNKDYIKVPEDGKHLPYKQYNGCMMLKVFLDTKTNLNKQDSEATQLKSRGCNQWLEEEQQLSIFDFINKGDIKNETRNNDKNSNRNLYCNNYNRFINIS